ncbi:hypothetical protein RND71_009196 [Anisodus tanguticus]|uniref:Uncharacterized protein n=1 Tax=Anisodus tanguticus TaxID=243964 RepID=A0AAE1SHD3_9SOLA|nr:hypothetical protein RND71_009196 [Anisodus tanguticus]
MTQEKKSDSHEGKLAIRDANLFKAQQKKKSIVNTKKSNIFDQITITIGEEATSKFNQKSVPPDQICKARPHHLIIATSNS